MWAQTDTPLVDVKVVVKVVKVNVVVERKCRVDQ
jgi:hypothetical protein